MVSAIMLGTAGHIQSVFTSPRKFHQLLILYHHPCDRDHVWSFGVFFADGRSTVSYSFQRAYIHVAEYLIQVLIRLVCFQGDRRVGMLSEWELSRMRVRVRRPTSVHCNIVEYVLMGGWRMVLSGKRETREKTGNLQASTHGTPEAHSEHSG